MLPPGLGSYTASAASTEDFVKRRKRHRRKYSSNVCWTSAREWRILSPVKPLDHIVFVVDDDRGICDAVADLLSTFDLQVVAFGSAAEYLAYPKPDVPACPFWTWNFRTPMDSTCKARPDTLTPTSSSSRDTATFPNRCVR
jgi:hypothetical protein